ncbi:MAG: hypothetical protein R3230_00265 [Nitrosopumilaceae archaeon]|nr:hypothetical protein [Nitrosopumilaceae archaeon]
MAYLPLNIVYDLDDVLADFWQTVLPKMNQEFGTSVKKSQFKDYNRFGDFFGIGFDEFADFLVHHKLLEQLKPHRNVIDDLNFSVGLGATVSIVSSRDFHPNAYDITHEWLINNGVCFDNLHISGKIKKSSVVSNVDVVYDDHHKHLDDYLNSGVLNKGAKVYLMNQPWNEHYSREGVKRISHSDFIFNEEKK